MYIYIYNSTEYFIFTVFIFSLLKCFPEFYCHGCSFLINRFNVNIFHS